MRTAIFSALLIAALPLAAAAQSMNVPAAAGPAQGAATTPQPGISDFAAGLAAMVDEAHVREVNLQAQLAAAKAQAAREQQMVASLTTDLAAAKAQLAAAKAPAAVAANSSGAVPAAVGATTAPSSPEPSAPASGAAPASH